MRGLADGITSSYQVGGPPCGRSRSACGGPAGCASLRGCGPAPQGARVRAPGALGAPRSGLRPMRGPAPRPSPVPGCPSLRSGRQRFSGPLSAPPGRQARPAWGGLAPGPVGLRLPLRGTARFVPRSLAAACRRGGPAPRPASGLPRGPAPAVVGSAPAAPPLAGCARGLSAAGAWPALRGSAASLRGWSALALSGLGPALPPPPRYPLPSPRPCGPGSASPPGLVAPRGAAGRPCRAAEIRRRPRGWGITNAPGCQGLPRPSGPCRVPFSWSTKMALDGLEHLC